MAVVDDYFAAFARRDADAMAGLWAPDGVDHIAGQGNAAGPAGVREYFASLFTAFPDLELEVRSTVAEDGRAAVPWSATGTMLGPLWGGEPTGAPVQFEGIDVLHVREGKMVRNDAVPDAPRWPARSACCPVAGRTASSGCSPRSTRAPGWRGGPPPSATSSAWPPACGCCGAASPGG